MMVDVVTQQAAQEQHVETVQAADNAAAEEMAVVAQSAPVEETAEEEASSSEEQQQWEDILAEDEEDSDEMPTDATPGLEDPEQPEETALEETTEEIPPVEIPTAEEPAAEEPEPENVEIPEAVTPEDTRTPEQVQEEITTARKTAREKLVDSFKWTEEQTEQFEENPSAVMSSMAADLFLDLYDSISQGLRSQMPGMVQGIMSQQDAMRKNEQTFYNAWPDLSKPEYRATIDRIANTYRQQYPSTDNATAVKEIGAQAWVALRLPLDQLVAQTTVEAKAPAARPAVIPNHVPASAGNAPQSAKVPVMQAGNEFESLADELLNDDME